MTPPPDLTPPPDPVASLRSGKKAEHDVTTFSQDRIIDDFLRVYAKWMGW